VTGKNAVLENRPDPERSLSDNRSAGIWDLDRNEQLIVDVIPSTDADLNLQVSCLSADSPPEISSSRPAQRIRSEWAS
jgi:hypothetical protein